MIALKFSSQLLLPKSWHVIWWQQNMYTVCRQCYLTTATAYTVYSTTFSVHFSAVHTAFDTHQMLHFDHIHFVCTSRHNTLYTTLCTVAHYRSQLKLKRTLQCTYSVWAQPNTCYRTDRSEYCSMTYGACFDVYGKTKGSV